MKLTLEVEWVPGRKSKEFGDMLKAICAADPATLHAAIPAIEHSGFVAKLDAKGEDLSIHFVSDYGEALPQRVAVLHSRANTPKEALIKQVAAYL